MFEYMNEVTLAQASDKLEKLDQKFAEAGCQMTARDRTGLVRLNEGEIIFIRWVIKAVRGFFGDVGYFHKVLGKE